MKQRNLGLMVFYNGDNKILLQDRSNMSKYGEEYGYFGGKIEEDESPETATKREIKEELEFDLKDIAYLGRYESVGKRLNGIDEKVIQEVFITKISKEEFESMVLHEGAGMEWFSIEEAKKLNMYPLDPKILDDAEEFMSKK